MTTTHIGAVAFLNVLIATDLAGPIFNKTILPIPAIKIVEITSVSEPREREKWELRRVEMYEFVRSIISERRDVILDYIG